MNTAARAGVDCTARVPKYSGGVVVLLGILGSSGMKFVPDKTGTEMVRSVGIPASNGLPSSGAAFPKGRIAMKLTRASKANPIPAPQRLITLIVFRVRSLVITWVNCR